MLTLNAQKRDAKEKPAALRRAGKMPAVFYGRKETSTSIALSLKEFHKIWKKVGESTVISLTGDFGEHEALINDVDTDPVTDVPRHADFYVIEKGQTVKVKVPLEFIGISPAVKELGGTLVKVVHGLEVEAAPKDLPQKIEVDISSLVDFKRQVLVRHLKVPANVKVLVNPEEVIASVAEFKEEVEEVTPAVDVANIELSEKKGKEPKEGEAAAPADGAVVAAKSEKTEKPEKSGKSEKK